ncbi:hypothetical protein MNEG_14518, partial [Monoraphidium neglectum]
MAADVLESSHDRYIALSPSGQTARAATTATGGCTVSTANSDSASSAGGCESGAKDPFLWPQPLPGDEHLVYACRSGDLDAIRVAATPLAGEAAMAALRALLSGPHDAPAPAARPAAPAPWHSRPLDAAGNGALHLVLLGGLQAQLCGMGARAAAAVLDALDASSGTGGGGGGGGSCIDGINHSEMRVHEAQQPLKRTSS